MAFKEDYNAFFNQKDFAVQASFIPRTGGNSSFVTGIFDNEYLEVEENAMVGVAASQPIFSCQTADIPYARGGSLVINGITYNIMEDKPDGTGISVLMLEENT